jgi:hypothetical protein
MNVAPLIIITVGTKGAIYQTTKIQLKQNLLILKTTSTKIILKAIYHNAVKILMHIILTKRKIENKQPLPKINLKKKKKTNIHTTIKHQQTPTKSTSYKLTANCSPLVYSFWIYRPIT